VRAWRGDAKTLLAFDLLDTSNLERFAGFTIQCTPGDHDPYFLKNALRFETPSSHAQVPTEPPESTVNAPVHYFRWLHVPGSLHQGLDPYYGKYTYTVTARFFDEHKSLLPIDPSKGTTITVDVGPFRKKRLHVGFTRGYVQSQAFRDTFGKDAIPVPREKSLDFDSSQVAGTKPKGEQYTWAQEWEWLGFTARRRIFELLDAVVADRGLRLDVFAYDLNEPDIAARLFRLARQRRIRIILDKAALHHVSPHAKKPPKTPKIEDEFEKRFRKIPGGSKRILRGDFDRYSHDKVFIVYRGDAPERVLTGSTNFSDNGLYVNANHVVVFDDPTVAKVYARVFDAAWENGASAAAFRATELSQKTFSFASAKTPSTEVTFAPHPDDVVLQNLTDIVARIDAERDAQAPHACVLFAVMGLDKGGGPVLPALNALHDDGTIFTYGISDSPAGVALYAPGKRTGLLVTGKPTSVRLPAPFNQVYELGRLDHEIHHKFIVCGFRSEAAVVYCGSSNLTEGGEEKNGDNLIAIRDPDVATAFAIEAVALVDHYNFLDKYSKKAGGKARTSAAPADKSAAAAQAGWWLSTGGGWAKKYFDPNDLKCADRLLFA
jgi:PLD-like domain